MRLTSHKYVPAEHEELFKKFVDARGLPARPNMEFLPPTGVVIYNYAQPICIGFMIKSDNGIAECTDFVSDPSVPKMLRNDAVEYMRKYFVIEARNHGMKALTAYCSIPKHIERLKSLGYIEMQTNLTHLGRFLWLSQD